MSASEWNQSTSPPVHGSSVTHSSSLLFNQANLAWTQPSGCILVAPKPTIPVSEAIESQKKSEEESQNSEFSDITTTMGQLHFTPQQQPDSSNNQQTFEASNQQIDQNDTLYDSPSTSSQSLPSYESQSPPSVPASYQEVPYHWYYQSDPESEDSWKAFSLVDSFNLESAFLQGQLDDPIPTNGTRFDVSLRDRTRKPVYWNGPTTVVQRCSWFYKKDSDFRSIPYSEYIASQLESTYRDCFTTNTWNRRVTVSENDFVYFYSSNSIYHYVTESTNKVDGWTGMMSDSQTQPKYVYRGIWLTNTQLERDECVGVDHLIFMVHGIGDFCDISFRRLVDVVGDFREITQDLLQAHYGSKTGGRVEALPISWHTALHTDKLDSHLKLITLPSVPRVRGFTNDTILDALFYTSAQHSQTILNAVASELNRIYSLFLSRNQHFSGSVALVGHSLGSLILFDLLSSQAQDQQPVQYPNYQLPFRPNALFALGSPIPVFMAVRGVETLDPKYQLPTCKAFYNIFHPYDPIAYRLEPLINKEFSKIKPVLIPHHKGRKRFHLEIRDSIARVGTDLKQKFMTSLKATWNSIYGFARAHRAEESDETEQLTTVEASQTTTTVDTAAGNAESKISSSMSSFSLFTELITPSIPETSVDNEADSEEILRMNFGSLNSGRRLDYVLQERPIELVNEYLFAIATHGCYWQSEDTSLLILRELYGQIGIMPATEEATSTESHVTS